MNKLVIVVVICLVVSSLTMAQDYRFGKVDDIDFKNTYAQGEEIPAAEVLYHNEDISWDYSENSGFTQKRRIHERIKINTADGLDYATKKIRLYNASGSRKETMSKLKGRTYNLIDGKIEDEKIRSENEFEEELSENYKQESFTMPDARVGSVIEYEYLISSPFITIDDVILQYDIPIKRSEIRVVMLEYYIYNVMFNPRAAYEPSITRGVQDDKIRAELDAKQFELSNQVLTLEENDIPALKEEPMMGAVDNFRAKITIELAAKKFPNQAMEKMSTGWEAVASSIYDNDDFGGQLKRTKFFEDDLAKLVEGVVNPKEKASKILSFVQNKVKWNQYYGTMAQKGLKDAYEEGSGNVSDINLLLVSMLRTAGIDANPVLVSSRNNGTPLFPTRFGFDYVVAQANFNDGYYLMDATDENTGVNSLPVRALNWQGRVVKDNGKSEFVNLTPSELSTEMTIANVALNEDLTLTGTTQKRMTDYRAYGFRSTYRDRVSDDISKYFMGDTPGFEIKNLEMMDLKNPEKPVGAKFNVTLKNAAEAIGDKIYVTPLLNELTDENPFKLEDRQFPIDFVYPRGSKTIVNIDLPEGYAVESLPESAQYVYGDNVGVYKYTVSQNGNRISVMSDYTMNGTTVIPNDYKFWKQFFTSIVDKDAEKIVLKKI
ncbi:DUF3857 domain-containing protein [Nonlabens marinus]|uniref:DUF3857 domain-containing protein n=1 Tax=Nonlabens marinus S1-08 TaxID=1454201 RepID=W8VND2_9FLAO|nr:DUF3857 domain-containing protein [Nonlabens marinus]BAO54379.1 hypothetical protein NMS_0370 [Nonlabens marinus S1-08]